MEYDPWDERLDREKERVFKYFPRKIDLKCCLPGDGDGVSWRVLEEEMVVRRRGATPVQVYSQSVSGVG